MNEPEQPPGTAAADDTADDPTLFNDEDDDEIGAGDEPDRYRITAAEIDDIEKQVAEIVANNSGRPPAEQISVKPEDVN